MYLTWFFILFFFSSCAHQTNVTPVTTEFKNMPIEHDGTNPFSFELHFSENLSDLSYKTLKNTAFQITHGKVIKAKRFVKGSNQRWNITVQPDSKRAVTVSFVPETDCGQPSALCTSDNRTVKNPLSAHIKRQLFDFTPMPAPWLEEYPIIQQEVEKIIKNKKEEIKKDAEELFQEFPHTALLPYELQVKELKLFEHDRQNIVSVRMAIRVYTGGAHGNKFYDSWNWDRQKNKFISLNEFITPEQFQALIKHARHVIFEKRKQNDKYDKKLPKEIEEGTSDEEDFKVWNFKKNGVEVTFPEYQVASFAEGHFEVFVSLDSLE